MRNRLITSPQDFKDSLAILKSQENIKLEDFIQAVLTNRYIDYDDADDFIKDLDIEDVNGLPTIMKLDKYSPVTSKLIEKFDPQSVQNQTEDTDQDLMSFFENPNAFFDSLK